MDRMIHTKNVLYEYNRLDEEGNIIQKHKALEDVNLSIHKGQFVAIVGANGSGKSTLARHLNALLLPTSGTVLVEGLDTSNKEEQWQIHQKAGMVFQNPDNQMITTMVEEDVAFGPENLGIPTKQIWERVEESLKKVGLTAYHESAVHKLSGGQKQRVAIAGVMAMRPSCMILDEPTAMLDPLGRKEVLDAVHELNQKEQITIILITHHIEETIDADYIYVMDQGHVVMQGTPREVLTRREELEQHQLEAPLAISLAAELRKQGLEIPDNILTDEELIEALCH